jgi:hypothetical protein
MQRNSRAEGGTFRPGARSAHPANVVCYPTEERMTAAMLERGELCRTRIGQ